MKEGTNQVEFRSFWRKSFMVILQNTNAIVILKKLTRLVGDFTVSNFLQKDSYKTAFTRLV